MLYFQEAERLKGNTGEHLMALLERRLDNVVLAAGLALSRNHARQLVNHGHFTINGKWVDVASYQVRPGDEVTPRHTGIGGFLQVGTRHVPSPRRRRLAHSALGLLPGSPTGEQRANHFKINKSELSR